MYFKYLGAPKVDYCPLDRTNHVSFIQRGQRVSSHITNGAVCRFGQNDHPKYKITQFNPTADVHGEPDIKLFWVVWDTHRGHDASQYSGLEEGIGRWHKKGSVITGFSGQVHFIRFEYFQREQNLNKLGLLWCVPDSATRQ